MIVEDLGIEAKEAAVREVAKLLPLPELLQSISSIKADYITRQQANDAQLSMMVAEQVEQAQAGLESIPSSQKTINQLRENFLSIERLCQECQNLIENHDQIKVLSNVRNNLNTTLKVYGIGYLSNRVLHNLLSEIRCLRVLCLHNYRIVYLPNSIGKLQHLCYLDLYNALLEKLPTSICTLYNLQTLILSRCSNLYELPSRIENLINLRYLDILGTPLREMPSHIGHLKCLQNLSYFIVGQKSRSIMFSMGTPSVV